MENHKILASRVTHRHLCHCGNEDPGIGMKRKENKETWMNKHSNDKIS